MNELLSNAAHPLLLSVNVENTEKFRNLPNTRDLIDVKRNLTAGQGRCRRVSRILRAAIAATKSIKGLSLTGLAGSGPKWLPRPDSMVQDAE